MSSANLDGTFHALSDPTRREILAHLMRGEAGVTDIAALYSMSLNAVSKHIKVLEKSGLVERRIEGRNHYLSLDALPMMQAEAWIHDYREFWTVRLKNLRKLVEGVADSKKTGSKRREK